jgi:21S rRNA (GM2251-2'-O)-methyltransferase
VQFSYKENTPDHIQRILNKCKDKKINVKYLPKDKLDKYTSSRPHNGLVLKCEPRDYIYIKNFNMFVEKFSKKPKSNLIVLLDQIVDPQNFGSIVRTAFFLGADNILVNKKNKSPISPSVCKVSSGASECTDLFAVKKLKPFLAGAINRGWTVISTSIEKENDVQLKNDTTQHTNQEKETEEEKNDEDIIAKEPNLDVTNVSLTELKIPNDSNVILVLGSEANGITSDIKGVANYNVFIPPQLNKNLNKTAPYDIIDSLNVGVSAGIIINSIKVQLREEKSSN